MKPTFMQECYDKYVTEEIKERIMKREEEIKKAAEYAYAHISELAAKGKLDGTFTKIFALGAEWADEHPAETEEATKLDDITTREGFYRAFQKHKFKPFDKVLVRKTQLSKWCCALFSHMDYSAVLPTFVTTNFDMWQECIPYEGNEYLVGTTNNPE